MTKETLTYQYTVNLNRLISMRIEDKNIISKLGNDVFKLNLEIGKNKKHLAKLEKEIDETVMEYNKK